MNLSVEAKGNDDRWYICFRTCPPNTKGPHLKWKQWSRSLQVDLWPSDPSSMWEAWLVVSLQLLCDTFNADVFTEVAEACAATRDLLHVGFGEPAPLSVWQPDALHPAWWTKHTASYYLQPGVKGQHAGSRTESRLLPSLVMVLAWRMSAFSSVSSSCSWAW